MHKQEIFDIVAKHLLTQKEKSNLEKTNFTDSDICAYRSPDGLKCAAGVLIKDEFYTPDLERKDSTHSKVQHALTQSLGYQLSDEEQSLLYRLQILHDRTEPHGWKSALKNLAIQKGFTFNFEEVVA